MAPHWEPLGKDLRVLVDGVHGFNTDTLLLAGFALPRPGERCGDFGTGCGTIPLLWCCRGKPAHVTAVELQAPAADLAARSIEANGYGERITLLRGDVRDYKALLPHQSLDRIACNPPYYPPGTGAKGEDPQRDAARRGESLTLEDVARAARYALTCGGKLCICLPSWRLAEAIGTLREHRLEPKRLRLAQQNVEKAPYLFLLEAVSGGRPGLAVEPVLLIREESGFSREMRRIYGDYTENGKGSE